MDALDARRRLTLIDTNVFIDIATRDPLWFERSSAALAGCLSLGSIFAVDVVFAEFAAGFDNAADCAVFLETLGIEHLTMTRDALWRTGRAFRNYRARGGSTVNVLVDFFIGAQASASGLPILTRDSARYRTHIPEVEILQP
jgi:predicted nucleic acid-binding protein